jgi:hypothetical protein
MKSEKGEFRGGRRGGYARVHLEADLTEDRLEVVVDLDSHGWNNQIREGSFGDWEEGTVYGVRYGIETAGIRSGYWRIRRIVGLIVDTTPMFLAFAAAQAVWKIVGYSPSEDHIRQMTEAARSVPRGKIGQFPDPNNAELSNAPDGRAAADS